MNMKGKKGGKNEHYNQNVEYLLYLIIKKNKT